MGLGDEARAVAARRAEAQARQRAADAESRRRKERWVEEVRANAREFAAEARPGSAGSEGWMIEIRTGLYREATGEVPTMVVYVRPDGSVGPAAGRDLTVADLTDDTWGGGELHDLRKAFAERLADVL